MKFVNKPIVKIDAKALLSGQPVYTDDLAQASGCLIVKVLRSPHAYARIRSINAQAALKLEGIECILTYKDVPNTRFTFAGQSYPEPSPYDRLILDEYVRYVGDPVAIVAAKDEKTANKALRLIKVDYDVLDAVIDFEQAKDNKTVIHTEDNYHVNFDIGNDVKRNILSSGDFVHGDVESEFAACDIVLEETYHTKANSQAMMETFRTITYLDHNGRLVVISSTQIPFHCRRIMARALELPKTKVRIIKPRIGGGFGAKQTMVSELFPAVVTLKTGKPAKIVFDRYESFSASNSRHEMRVTVKLGAMENGEIRAIQMYTLSNTGAYSEHGPTTVGLVAHKTMPLYSHAKAYKFNYDVVYTNTMAAGAFRGYGATQGTFALESTVNQLAHKLGMDPARVREINMPKEGQVMPAYYGEVLASSALDRCVKRGKEMIGWDDKFPCRRVSDTKVRAVGMAVTMQGSAIAGIDTACAEIKLNDDGYYTLGIGATDMGTGCDTILAQMAADCLSCDMDKIIVSGVDTDYSPYDTGSYASSTTYLTGMAVVKACNELVEKIRTEGAKFLGVDKEDTEFDGEYVECISSPDKRVSLDDLAASLVVGSGHWLSSTATHGSPVSPPPLMAGFAEIELDTETGKVELVDYVGVVDCGTVINTNLARVQAEGGLAQGIGMALYEDIQYNKNGKMINNSFMQYKIPSRLDLPSIRVDFESSYEPTGPFGAKSIGEVVINTPCPAIADAVYNACGVFVRSLPITSEKIAMELRRKEG